ncbi:MAG: N-acetylmuramoyl-L-alanine amidase [Spirochaetales bacterium]|nr:N-acetylmuramoyl-L-alanine amidase [Spirochaetales bacterium]
MDKINRLFLIALLFFLTFALFGQTGMEVGINELISELKAEFYIDLYRGTGCLDNGEHTISFSPEIPFIMIDYQLLLPAPGIRLDESGSFFFSNEAVASIKRGFSKEFHQGGPIISTVILDPGHGGRDPGAIGRFTINGESKQFFEKDVVLKVAQIINENLKKDFPDRNVILTRSDDTYLTLEQRTEIANGVKLEENEAMIFISLHANASFNTKASGYEIWYLPSDYRRNLLDPGDIVGVDEHVIPILNTMLEEEFTKESISLARAILKGMDSHVGDRSVSRGLKEESWFVVRNAEMPSVLIETGFISNKEEALLLQDDSYLNDMGQGIYNGIQFFINGFENTKGFTE